MTCRYSGSDWLDVLYTSVRNTPGGVADAASFLTNRRGRSIGTESLRLRLRGEGENRLSMEMLELLVEWMEEKRQAHYLDAIYALNERFGLRATPADDNDQAESIESVTRRTLDITSQTGVIAQEVSVALADGRITESEADNIVAASRVSQRMLDRLVRAVRRLSKKNRR